MLFKKTVRQISHLFFSFTIFFLFLIFFLHWYPLHYVFFSLEKAREVTPEKEGLSKIILSLLLSALFGWLLYRCCRHLFISFKLNILLLLIFGFFFIIIFDWKSCNIFQAGSFLMLFVNWKGKKKWLSTPTRMNWVIHTLSGCVSICVSCYLNSAPDQQCYMRFFIWHWL